MFKKKSARRVPGSILVPVVMLALTGCTTLPDVAPFTQATADLRSAVVISGTTVESSLRGMQDGQSFADEFAGQWSARVKAMNGLVDYADSLQSIVDATGEAQSNAGALADNVATLATTAGIALPAAGSVSVATDIAKFVYGQIALVRGASSLEAALEASQPAIQQIANKMALDLGAARDILMLANTEVAQSLTNDNQIELGFRNGLTKERQDIYAKGAGNLSAGDQARLRQIDEMIKSTDSWYLPLMEQDKAISTRLEAGTSLLNAAIDGVAVWAFSHEQLVAAIKDRRPVSARSLAESAADIRSLVTRVREL